MKIYRKTQENETHSLLAITPPVKVEPLFPPHPTSITLSKNYTEKMSQNHSNAK